MSRLTSDCKRLVAFVSSLKHEGFAEFKIRVGTDSGFTHNGA
jgi:hypothetical protein